MDGTPVERSADEATNRTNGLVTLLDDPEGPLKEATFVNGIQVVCHKERIWVLPKVF